jgi:uncharacterized protein YlxP (DUF503 family)
MLVCVALFELDIEFAQSLKDKRMVVRSIKDKVRQHFAVSAAEVGLLDVHQRARLAVSFIALEHAAADAKFEKMQSFIESNTDAVLAGWIAEKLEFDESVSF